MFKNKLKNISDPVKASMGFMVATVLQQLVSVITTPIFTRVLTEGDYGIVNVYQSWLSIFTVILTLSLTAGVYNNAMIDFKDEIDDFTSSLLTLTTLNTLIFFVVFLLFKDSIASALNLHPSLIYLMFISILLNPAMGFWMARQRFNYKYKLSVTISVVSTIGGAILSYLLVMSSNLDKAFSKIFGGISFTIIFSIIMYVAIFVKGKKRFSKKYWKYALSFNIPLIPHYLSGIILAQSDRIFISKMVGNSEAGLYGVAYTAASVIGIVWNSINASWIPWTLQKMKSKSYSEIRKVANMIVLMCVVACIGFVILAPEIISIIAAPNYYQAIWVIPPVVLGIYFTFISSLFSNIEFYYKQTKFIMVASTVAAISNIILNIIFIPIYGYIAAAYTTLFSYAVLSISHYFFMKKIDNNDIYDIRFITFISIGLIIVCLLIMSVYNYRLMRYSFILLVIIIAIFNIKKVISAIKNIIK